jgi:parvulin-like peptidyl-prolyl isomerase
MQAGEISDLVPATNGGVAIVRVTDRRASHSMTLEEAAPILRTRLTQAARDARIEEILRQDRKRFGVKIVSARLGRD